MRYIDIDELINELENDDLIDREELAEYAAENIADVVPVKHGWWQDTGMKLAMRCSACGNVYVLRNCNEIYPEYCPCCGTKMDYKM